QGSVSPPLAKTKEMGSKLIHQTFSLSVLKSGHIMCYKIGLFYLLLTERPDPRKISVLRNYQDGRKYDDTENL
ncbi:MAG: hypothetical protein LLG40_12585, partial [Deltaproteobacteria bacterium]|nr:hypothetical protein [Deltaproteobacteria bacterium]